MLASAGTSRSTGSLIAGAPGGSSNEALAAERQGTVAARQDRRPLVRERDIAPRR